jgi:S-adenosylmethionine hydrolase
LLTDFGLQDHYVGSMKGVIAGICPDALLIDITHGVAPQDIRGGACELAAAWPFFPPQTVFVVVVDPGVGTDRAAIALRIGDTRFVGPDNGVFDLVLRQRGPDAAHRLDNPQLQRPTVSATFEGRDRFAPAAAWLAAGTPVEQLGTAIVPGVRLEWSSARTFADRVVGEVVHVDRFGNLITNIARDSWPPHRPPVEAWIAAHGPIPVVRTYGDAPAGSLIALFGSTGRLEVALVSGHAAAATGVSRGAEVRVVPGA